jgi:hypothetical protein
MITISGRMRYVASVRDTDEINNYKGNVVCVFTEYISIWLILLPLKQSFIVVSLHFAIESPLPISNKTCIVRGKQGRSFGRVK